MIAATIYGKQSQNNHIISASVSRMYNLRHNIRRKRKKCNSNRQKKKTFVRISCEAILMDKNTFFFFVVHLFITWCGDSHAEFNFKTVELKHLNVTFALLFSMKQRSGKRIKTIYGNFFSSTLTDHWAFFGALSFLLRSLFILKTV